MQMMWTYVRYLGIGLMLASPILLLLGGIITWLGLLIGKREGWTRGDALYYAFITATTVGYGDFRPRKPLGKLLAVPIAIVGLLATGLVVSVGTAAAVETIKRTVDPENLGQIEVGARGR